jgi:outer membrane immunogenic protein
MGTLAYGLPVSNDMVIGLGLTYDLNETKAGRILINGVIDARLKMKNHWSVYAQPTYLVSQNTGIFAKVGYHDTKGEIEEVLGGVNESRKVNGWGFGVGVKTFVSKNLYVQAEVQKVSFKKKTLDAATNATFKGDTTAGILRVGYKF